MKTKEKITIIEKLLAHYQEMRAMSDAMYELFGAVADSRAMNPQWKAFDSYTDCVAKLVGDDWSWISWFIWENDCGKKELAAGKGNRMKPIKTVKDLVEMLEAIK